METTPVYKQKQVDILNEPPPVDDVQHESPPAPRGFLQNFGASLLIMACALALNIVLYFVLNRVFKVNYLFSNAWAWLAYTLFLYVARKLYFFRATATGFKAKWREFYRFMGLRVGTGVLDMVLMFILVSIMGVHTMNAKFVALAVVTVINAVLTNFWIFRKQPDPAAKPENG